MVGQEALPEVQAVEPEPPVDLVSELAADQESQRAHSVVGQEALPEELLAAGLPVLRAAPLPVLLEPLEEPGPGADPARPVAGLEPGRPGADPRADRAPDFAFFPAPPEERSAVDPGSPPGFGSAPAPQGAAAGGSVF